MSGNQGNNGSPFFLPNSIKLYNETPLSFAPEDIRFFSGNKRASVSMRLIHFRRFSKGIVITCHLLYFYYCAIVQLRNQLYKAGNNTSTIKRTKTVKLLSMKRG